MRQATRLVGNDRVPEHLRYQLRIVKALKQGRELAPRSWWPALEGLTAQDQALVRRQVADEVTWRARSATIGRWPNDIPPSIPYAAEGP